MTRRDKVIMLSSILLAIAVIASAVLMVMNSTVDMKSLAYAGAVIFIGVSSVLVVYLSKVRKDRFEKMLSDEYFREYEVIRDSIVNSQLSKSSKTEIKEDILDMLISAQKAGKNIQDVVGNPEKFAREILLSYTSPIRFAVLNLHDGILSFTLIILGVSILLWLEQTSRSFFDIGIDINMVFFFALIAFVVIPLTKQLTSKQNHWFFMIPLAFGAAYVLLAEISRKYIYSVDLVKWLLDGTVNMIPNVAMLLMYCLTVPILLFLKTLVRKRLFKQYWMS